ncbi:transposase [Streptomyces canus]|uniref:transposase n=1 Tax=Streptomyces canus TaxID=58343 RepID=UPI00324AD9F9
MGTSVMSALLGYTSERRRLRRVGRDFGHLFPYVPQQSGHNKRLRAAFSLLTSMIRIMAVCTLGGLPVLFALTGAKADERETLRDMLDTAPDVLAVHPGQTIIGDKNYFGREFEHGLAERHLKLLRPARKGEAEPAGSHLFKPLRQVIESINQTFKGQLNLERHGGKSPAGVSDQDPAAVDVVHPQQQPPGSCAGSSHSQRRSGTTTKLDSPSSDHSRPAITDRNDTPWTHSSRPPPGSGRR